ncbi:NAD(P)/FAD-dependent oxidoreductase [Pseudohongiella spirulinae]|uniref:Pyridine nucleotide-disulfide oxidoreductase n=1 Tax=Pseudohongiella spirulinae TaxID=1249552 RepID=A0A0S2KEM2_9GAMM|nr:FAD/NAD(P)-binding oxidoreductase [Pseudohongiella spirulinae]ALO46547.1 Pyridine nucleotide-disulfide oxidoreductase [Pseudohongiella spirulinae]
MSESSQNLRCVIVGASHAGSQLAIQLRKNGWTGEIVLIGDESQMPYHRPPLSKAVMSGEKDADGILLRPAPMYQAQNVTLRLNERVQSLSAENKQVVLVSGEVLAYDKLALCTGARPIRLPLGDGLDGVCYLRTLADVEAIRARLDEVRRVVVIGAGYIGLEAAAVLRKLGKDVTVLERAERVLQRVTGPQMSAYFQNLHRHHGVDIHCSAEVVAINGQQSVESVTCADGSTFKADLVIVGIGVVPETGLAEMAGLKLDNGICVDEHACTSDPDIYAAGDCCSHPSALYQRRVRLESVQNANDQSRVAAANICGANEVYNMTPWFWSDQYDVKLQAAGLCDGYDRIETDGSAEPGSEEGFVVTYYRDGELIAADCINRAKDFMYYKKLLGS